MKENYDLISELEEIRRRGINYGASIGNGKYRIDDLIEKVPDVFVAAYGEEKARLKWKNLARLYYYVMSTSLEADMVATLRELIAMYNEQLKFIYKGKDGKDYSSFEEVQKVNEFYTLHENPTIEKGRSR